MRAVGLDSKLLGADGVGSWDSWVMREKGTNGPVAGLLGLGATPLQLNITVKFISDALETLAELFSGCILGQPGFQCQLGCLSSHSPCSILDETTVGMEGWGAESE